MDFSLFRRRIYNVFLHRRTLWDMSISQLRAKYAGLKLGIWWVIIIPITMALCINFVFVLAFKVDIPHYAFFILSGLFPWFFISQAVSESTEAFIANKSILRQGVFPREFIPLSSGISNFLNFILGFVIIIPLFFLINFSVITLIPWLILAVFSTLFFVLGLGLIFSTMNSFWRDTSHFLSVGLMFWFWITPVFYSASMLDFPYRWVCLLNPATYYIAAFQKILYHAVPLGLADLILLFFISFLTLLLGYLYYLRSEPEILKRT